ncbi:hypothetical protein WMY93_001329 [Mugilogobius chulae]|uniref:Uncharacterized protein n=1 Tax=Mugilogobius chulae TaxID=88201 RepID=A0AAW0Q1H7_9GOBI
MLRSHLCCQTLDTIIRGHEAFGALGLDIGLVSRLLYPAQPSPPPPPQQHPTYKTVLLLRRLISSVLFCHPDLDGLPFSNRALPSTQVQCHFVSLSAGQP